MVKLFDVEEARNMKLRFHFLEKEVENRNKFEIWAEI